MALRSDFRCATRLRKDGWLSKLPIRVLLGFCGGYMGDNGKESGNYYNDMVTAPVRAAVFKHISNHAI